MPAFVRGYVVCNGCGATASAVAQVSARSEVELYWELPEGWQLYARGRGTTIVYCSGKCNGRRAAMGYPDIEGKRKQDPAQFDARALDKLYELIETAAHGSSADNVLAAIEAVLLAWRQKKATT